MTGHPPPGMTRQHWERLLLACRDMDRRANTGLVEAHHTNDKPSGGEE